MPGRCSRRAGTEAPWDSFRGQGAAGVSSICRAGGRRSKERVDKSVSKRPPQSVPMIAGSAATFPSKKVRRRADALTDLVDVPNTYPAINAIAGAETRPPL